MHIFRSSCLFSAFGLLPHECHLWHAPFFRAQTILETQITRQISHGGCNWRLRVRERERRGREEGSKLAHLRATSKPIEQNNFVLFLAAPEGISLD